MRAYLLFVVLAACGSSAKPSSSPATASSGATDAPSTSPTAATAPSSTTGGGTKDAPATAPAGAKSDSALAILSTSEADCGLDGTGKPWKWPNGKLEAGPTSLSGAKAISCSSTHTCVVTGEGTVSCWGDNTYGALGDGTQKNPDGPVVAKDVKNAEEVDVDVSRTCARTSGGEVYCWGDREFAKAGDGTLIDGHKGREKPLPGKPVLGLAGANSLAVSLVHSCASTGDGSVMCWGQCRSGACGQPPRPPWIPRAMKAPKVSGVGSLSAGDVATCGIDKSGGVMCWGTSQYGVLGESVADTKPHEAPSKIALPSAAAEVRVGIGGHACARLSTGAVYCWGHNDHGQLGDGTTTDRKSPAPVKGVDKALHIAAGDSTACAVVEGGRLFCWGQKRVMKKGALEDAPTPVEITK